MRVPHSPRLHPRGDQRAWARVRRGAAAALGVLLGAALPVAAPAQWSIGGEAELTLLGNVLKGMIGPGECAGSQGQVFAWGADKSLELSLADGYKLTVSGLCLLLPLKDGKVPTPSQALLGGMAKLSLPDDSPLRALIGNDLDMGIAGNAVALKLVLNKAQNLTLAEAGKPMKIALNLQKTEFVVQKDQSPSLGGAGTLTIGEQQTQFQLAWGTDKSVTATVKDADAEITLLNLLKGRIQGNVSLVMQRAGLYPMSRLAIDKVEANAAALPGTMGFAATKLDYYLPATVPPFGLPFGNLSASVGVGGLGLEIDLSLDKPEDKDMVAAVTALAGAMAGKRKSFTELDVSDVGADKDGKNLSSGVDLAKTLIAIGKGDSKRAADVAGTLEKPSLTARAMKVTFEHEWLRSLFGDSINLLPTPVVLKPADLAAVAGDPGSFFDKLLKVLPKPPDKLKDLTASVFSSQMTLKPEQGQNAFTETPIQGLVQVHRLLRELDRQAKATLPAPGVRELPIDYGADLKAIQGLLALLPTQGEFTRDVAVLVASLKDKGFQIARRDFEPADAGPGNALKIRGSGSEGGQSLLQLSEYDGRYDITGLRWNKDSSQWEARFGTVRLYPEPGYQGDVRLLTEDLSGSNGSASRVGSVRLEGRARVQLSDRRTGRTTTLRASVSDLANTRVRPAGVNDVRLWWPIDLARVSGWRLDVTTSNNLRMVAENGGVSVTLPARGDADAGGEPYRLLSLLPQGRLSTALAQVKLMASRVTGDDATVARTLFDQKDHGRAMSAAWAKLMGSKPALLSQLPGQGSVEYLLSDGYLASLEVSELGPGAKHQDKSGPFKVAGQSGDGNGTQYFTLCCTKAATGSGEENLKGSFTGLTGWDGSLNNATRWRLLLGAPGAKLEKRAVIADDAGDGSSAASWARGSFAAERWRSPVTLEVARYGNDRTSVDALKDSGGAATKLADSYTEIRGTLWGGRSSVLLDHDDAGKLSGFRAVNQRGQVYPETGWVLYGGKKPLALKTLAEVGDQVKLAYREITVDGVSYPCEVDGLGRLRRDCGPVLKAPTASTDGGDPPAATFAIAPYSFEAGSLRRISSAKDAAKNQLLLAYDKDQLATGFLTVVGEIKGGLRVGGSIKAGLDQVITGTLDTTGLLNATSPVIQLSGGLKLFDAFELTTLNGTLRAGGVDLAGNVTLPKGLGSGTAALRCGLGTAADFALTGAATLGDTRTLGAQIRFSMDGTLAKGPAPALDMRGAVFAGSNRIFSGELEYRDGRVSFDYGREVTLGLGLDVNAGIDGRITLKGSPLAGTFKGSAHLGMEWPIKLWYCADWCTFYPCDCGWHEVYRLSLHQSVNLDDTTIDANGGFSRSFSLGPVSPRLTVNLRSAQPFSVSW